MAEGFTRNARYGRCWSALVCIWLVIVCALMLLPRTNDFLGLYSELVRFAEEDIIGMYSAGAKAPDYTRGLGLTDLKHMLAAGSPAVRASAVQALGYRREDEIVALLVQLLNDTELVDIGGEQKSISTLSRTALTQSIRDRITLEPSNIRILIPYLSGPPKERRCSGVL